ncbi:MAG: hypothetical protein ABI759_21335 [Candidatus Solibacter sp.]
MKLRLQGNSVRLRLTRSEVERFRDTGIVEESVDFGGGETLAYGLHSRKEPGPVQAGFREGTLTVSVPIDAAQAWAGSDEVGVYAQSGALAISIEKDFRCLTRPRDGEEPDAYPHPGEPTATRS